MKSDLGQWVGSESASAVLHCHYLNQSKYAYNPNTRIVLTRLRVAKNMGGRKPRSLVRIDALPNAPDPPRPHASTNEAGNYVEN